MKIARFSISTWLITISLILTIIFVVNSGEAGSIEGSTSPGKTTDLAVSLSDNRSLQNAESLLSVETGQNTLTIPNDPFFSEQWALDQMNITGLWNGTRDNGEILIAVLDTGIDCDHEDLKGKIIAEVNFTDSPTVNDLNGHGTHIAGIIAANADNGIGIAGLVPAGKLLNVKVADDYGSCQPATVARGIIWAVDNGAKVINVSLEITDPSAELEQAVNYAWSRGALIVAAAGNRGNDAAVYPAYYVNSIAVAATRPDNTLAPLSNYGDWVDAAAPGFNIYSTLPGNKYGHETGTSFAAACITGLAADLFTIVSDTNNDGRLNDEVRHAIESSFYRIDYAGLLALK